MDLTEYRQLAMRTLAPNVKAGDPQIFADPRSAMFWNACSGLASEAGEINEIFKKVYFHGHPFDADCQVHILKEMGDLMWYFALLSFVMQLDPTEILKINIEKLVARYPDGFDTERSMNRAPGDI